MTCNDKRFRLNGWSLPLASYREDECTLCPKITPQIQVIPAKCAEESKASGKNLKFIIGGFLLIGLVIVLMVQATVTTGAYYMTVSECTEPTARPSLASVRVSGTVVDGSEDWRPQEVMLRFAIADENGTHCQSSSLGHARIISSGRLRPSSKGSCSRMVRSRRRRCCSSVPAATNRNLKKSSPERIRNLTLSTFLVTGGIGDAICRRAAC